MCGELPENGGQKVIPILSLRFESAQLPQWTTTLRLRSTGKDSSISQAAKVWAGGHEPVPRYVRHVRDAGMF